MPHSLNAYRKFESQLSVFKNRFVQIDDQENLSADAVRVEFDGKIWQLKPDTVYAAVPGTSSHIAAKIYRQLAGLICVNPAPFADLNCPILVTNDLKDTIEKISALCTHDKI